MLWDNLIRAPNKVEARAKIQRNTHLDPRCPKGKRPLKMSLNSRDDQAKKAKTILPQAKASPSASDQSEAPEKIRKEKKKKWQQKERAKKDPKEGSPTPAVSESNAVQATGGQKKKKA